MAGFVRPLALVAGFACLVAYGTAAPPDFAWAQTPQSDAQGQPLKQMALTEAQIMAFLAVENESAPILAKQSNSQSEQLDAKTIAQLEAIAKKHQFASYSDFEDVGANIGLVADGVDPQTKQYVGAEAMLKKQIAAVQADKSMSADEKKQALADLNEALKAATPLKFPGNVDLVLKHYDEVVAALTQSEND